MVPVKQCDGERDSVRGDSEVRSSQRLRRLQQISKIDMGNQNRISIQRRAGLPNLERSGG